MSTPKPLVRWVVAWQDDEDDGVVVPDEPDAKMYGSDNHAEIEAEVLRRSGCLVSGPHRIEIPAPTVQKKRSTR